MGKVNDRIRRFLKLNWTKTPSWWLPHGVFGIISVVLGLNLIFFHSLTGRLGPYKNGNENQSLEVIPFKVLVYSLCTALNAIAGYLLVNSAPLSSQRVFKRCAILQVCLAYYVVRFMPYTVLFVKTWLVKRFLIIWIIDIFFSTISTLCTLSFCKVALETAVTSRILGQAIGVGILGILLLSVYPLQLTIFGEKWLECVYARYPMQGSGMVAFIYVPASTTFNLVMFGATLHLRRILSDFELGVILTISTIVCLIATVLSQEVHIPYVSTQRIYLPCEEPEEGTFSHTLVHLLDFSLYARSILSFLFDLKFENKV